MSFCGSLDAIQCFVLLWPSVAVEFQFVVINVEQFVSEMALLGVSI